VERRKAWNHITTGRARFFPLVVFLVLSELLALWMKRPGKRMADKRILVR
jgi:hypothetical protein